MKVTVRKKRVFALIDLLMERQKEHKYPYNRKDAVVPQAIIPEELRKNTERLALFYFFICVYMRGGIESLQVFRAFLRLNEEQPFLFEPRRVLEKTEEEIAVILKRYIGWDAKTAGSFWRRNAEKLELHWNGNPLNIIDGVRNYDEALRRIAHRKASSTAVDKKKLGNKKPLRKGMADLFEDRYQGFWGFQAKMTSMLIYFYDWEGWLEPRFRYPAPADFHHYRLNIAYGAIEIETENGVHVRYTEKVSEPYRHVLLQYLRKRNADPILVADAIWLFSLLMCGNSPATMTKVLTEHTPLFTHSKVAEPAWDHAAWLNARSRKALFETCGACALEKSCRYAIPAQPYYRKGRLVLRRRVPLPFSYIPDRIEGLSTPLKKNTP